MCRNTKNRQHNIFVVYHMLWSAKKFSVLSLLCLMVVTMIDKHFKYYIVANLVFNICCCMLCYHIKSVMLDSFFRTSFCNYWLLEHSQCVGVLTADLCLFIRWWRRDWLCRRLDSTTAFLTVQRKSLGKMEYGRSIAAIFQTLLALYPMLVLTLQYMRYVSTLKV